MACNNERVLNAIKGIHEDQVEYGAERKRSGAGGISSGTSFIPSYKKGMVAPKFRDPQKYKP